MLNWGALPTVQLVWNEGSRTVAEKDLRYREAYLWNLRADGSSLSGVIHYEIPNGTVRHLVIDLPPDLLVRNADVAAAAPDGAPARPRQSVRLRDWRVLESGTGRSLRLEFQNPIGGACDIRLELVPRVPLGAGSAALPLPTPRGAPADAPSSDLERGPAAFPLPTPRLRLLLTRLLMSGTSPIARTAWRPS